MSGSVHHRFLAGVDLDDVGAMLRSASGAMGRENLAWVEAMARMVLEKDPRNGDALNFLALVAHRVGALEWSVAQTRRAMEVIGEVPQLRENLRALETMIAARPFLIGVGEKFLVIKAWGEGFWSDVDHVLGACLLAEITGRVPVTDWGGNSRYHDGGKGDAFREFFEPVSAIRVEELAVREGDLYPAKWNVGNLREGEVNRLSGAQSRWAGVYFLARPERVAVSDCHVQVKLMMGWLPTSHAMRGKSVGEVYRYLVGKYLRPREEISDLVRGFVAEHFGEEPYVAVHVRGSDKVVEMPGIASLGERYHEAIGGLDPGAKIFLLTDSAGILEEYRERYGERIVTTGAERTSDAVAVHFKDAKGSARRRGVEVMVDAYIAAGAGWFVGNGRSNVSAMVEHLKDWGEGELFLVEPNQHDEINASIWGIAENV